MLKAFTAGALTSGAHAFGDAPTPDCKGARGPVGDQVLSYHESGWTLDRDCVKIGPDSDTCAIRNCEATGECSLYENAEIVPSGCQDIADYDLCDETVFGHYEDENGYPRVLYGYEICPQCGTCEGDLFGEDDEEYYDGEVEEADCSTEPWTVEGRPWENVEYGGCENYAVDGEEYDYCAGDRDSCTNVRACEGCGECAGAQYCDDGDDCCDQNGICDLNCQSDQNFYRRRRE